MIWKQVAGPPKPCFLKQVIYRHLKFPPLIWKGDIFVDRFLEYSWSFLFSYFIFNQVAYSLEKKQRKICRLICSVYCKHTMCMICPVSSSSSSSCSKDSIQLWAENKHSRHWTQSTSLTVNEMWMKTRHFLSSYLHLRHFLFCLVSLTVASHTSFK